jgi:hypothetical protein
MIRVGDGVRVRKDRIDKNGKVTLRHRTRLHHIGVGHAHKGKRVIMLVDGPRDDLGWPDPAPRCTSQRAREDDLSRANRASKAVVRASHDLLRKSKIALPVIRAPTTKIKVAR